MFLAVHSSFFFANSAWTLPQKMPRIFFLWGPPFMQNIRYQTSREYSGNVLMSIPLYCLILPCGELDFSSHLSGNHAWELFFPKGEKFKHLSALARTCICREPRKQLQVRNWTVGWGKRRNPKYKVLFVLWSMLSFCCLSDGEGSWMQGWAKTLPVLMES